MVSSWCQVCVWMVLELCLDGDRMVSGLCLGGIWMLSGLCLDGV